MKYDIGCLLNARQHVENLFDAFDNILIHNFFHVDMLKKKWVESESRAVFELWYLGECIDLLKHY